VGNYRREEAGNIVCYPGLHGFLIFGSWAPGKASIPIPYFNIACELTIFNLFVAFAFCIAYS
jgi:hypothetical protein